MGKISRCRATVLCENSVAGPFGLVGEHGWSLYVEADETILLFDTGQGQGILTNSLILQKDLNEIRAVILSHGHYDHTSGLPAVMNITGARPVFCHPDAFLNRYWRSGRQQREIGMRYKKAYLEAIGADFNFVTEFKEIFPGIYLTGEVPRTTAFEKEDPNMQVRKPDGTWEQDHLKDDLSLVIDTQKGLLVVIGCAHAGIINILTHVKNNLPDRPIHTVVGGTHLGFADTSQMEQTIMHLERFNIKRLGASHCTGLENAARLFSAFGDRFFFASVGVTLEI